MYILAEMQVLYPCLYAKLLLKKKLQPVMIRMKLYKSEATDGIVM